MNITSDFLILDVKEGRHELARNLPLRLTLDVELNHQHGRDDGTSIEFSGEVKALHQGTMKIVDIWRTPSGDEITIDCPSFYADGTPFDADSGEDCEFVERRVTYV